MILKHLKQLDLSTEELESFMELACEMFERPEKQNVTHCFEASGGKNVCEFVEDLCCRTCGAADLDCQEMFIGNPMFWPKWKTEPSQEDIMTSYYCDQCQRLTMASEAVYCLKCGMTLFLENMDEEIFGA